MTEINFEQAILKLENEVKKLESGNMSLDDSIASYEEAVRLVRICNQKLENADIKAWEYSKGPMYGFKNYKEYVNARQEGKCLICGKKHIDEYHHIVPKSQGGTDRVNNIAGLCHDCHQSVSGVHKDKNTQNTLLDLVDEADKNYSVGLLNSVMPALIEAMQEYCNKNKLTLIITDGYETSKTRKALGLDSNKTDKDGGHHIDVYCISLAGRELPNMVNVFMPDVLHHQQRFKKKSNNNISANNTREYWFNGKCVAKNRHKATEQQEDSLDEYVSKYAKTHNAKECATHMHELDIKPAERTYTFHKENKVAPIHVGDVVKYEKRNKTKDIRKAIFIAMRVRVFNGTVNYSTKNKKLKFCKRLKSGCVPFIDSEKINIK